jgi:hypothetical protein
MTEASPMTDPQVVSILDNLRNISNEVKQIDAELGTDVSGPVAQRNKIANQLVAQHTSDDNSDVNRFVNQVVGPLVKEDGSFSDIEKLTAVVTHLNNQISKLVGNKVTEYLKSQVDSQPTPATPEISEARKQELADRRSNITNIFKLQNEMLKYYGVTELPADIEVPAVRRGAIGKRVKLNKEFQFYVDGNLKQLTDQDTGQKTNAPLSYIATTVCKDKNWKAKDLRNFIVENVDGATASDTEVNLPDTWEVTLPAPINKTLRGVAITVTDDSASSVDDSEDDEDDDDNGTEESNDFQM